MLPTNTIGQSWPQQHGQQVMHYLSEAVLCEMKEQDAARGLPPYPRSLQGDNGMPDPALTRLHHSGAEYVGAIKARWRDLCEREGGVEAADVLKELAGEIKERMARLDRRDLSPQNAKRINLDDPRPVTVPAGNTASLPGLAPIIEQAVAAGIAAGLKAAQPERH